MSTAAVPERLALTVVPGAGWSSDDIRSVAMDAEGAGVDATFTRVGTWIANIYLRHPYVCPQGAALIAEATGGRFVLGPGGQPPARERRARHRHDERHAGRPAVRGRGAGLVAGRGAGDSPSTGLIGPVDRCRARLAEYRDAGVDLPILNPPIGPDAARSVIEAFRREGAGRRAAPVSVDA